MYVINPVTEVLDFVAGHLAIIGWPVLLGLVWRVRGAVDTYFTDQKVTAKQISDTLAAVEDAKKLAITKVTEAATDGALKAEGLMKKIESNASALHVISENHLTHLSQDVVELKNEQRAVMDKHLEVLQSIDSNIKILVDRAPQRRGRG